LIADSQKKKGALKLISYFQLTTVLPYLALSSAASKTQKVKAISTPRGKVVKGTAARSGGPVKGNAKGRKTRGDALSMISTVTTPRVQRQPPKNGAATSNQPNRGNKTANRSTIATVQAIAQNASHPKRKEAQELLNAHKRGWVDDKKLVEALKTLIF
jgi:hypothetical protein